MTVNGARAASRKTGDIFDKVPKEERDADVVTEEHGEEMTLLTSINREALLLSA